ncbi:MAG: hypothetical protein ACYCYM_06660 [Saccharofermentanales bacterium]
MARRTYIHDGKYSSRFAEFKHRLLFVLKIFAYIAAAATILYAVYLGVLFSADKKMEKEYDSFTSACATGDYESAIGIYRELHEKVLSGSLIFINKTAYQALVFKIEGEINGIIEIPFNSLVNQSKPLTNDDLDMLEKFSEISVMKISGLVTDYLEEFLLGGHSADNVVLTLSELKKVDSISEPIALYEGQIQEISSFSPIMKKINVLYSEKSYLDTIIQAQAEIGRQNGFVKEYLISFIADVKVEAYPILTGEIDVMMSMGKYYSAKSLLEQVLLCYPSDEELSDRYDECADFTKQKLAVYSKPVEHIAIRPLISTPGFRFDQNGYTKTAEDLMITAGEFKKILEQLYANQYVLIDINSLVDSKGKYHPIMIPEGKKPLILSIEGLNYYASRRLTGNSMNIALDPDGHVVSEYYGENGVIRNDRNGEAIGILEQFIEQNPDFSFDGSKGNISLTGFECIFGYITDKDQVDDRTSQFTALGLGNVAFTDEQIDTNRQTVKTIIAKLAADGWTFSSSTYGNIMVNDVSIEVLKSDTAKWEDQVGGLIGNARVILFPNGGIVSSKDPKGSYLIDEGFTIHCGIGPTAYFNSGTRNLFMDRIALNGYALRNYNLKRFFDVKYVYDAQRTIRLP